jgi:hypothetical protein
MPSNIQQMPVTIASANPTGRINITLAVNEEAQRFIVLGATW